MKATASQVAEQYRLQQWAAQIRECQNRSEGITILEWCEKHGVTKANYYYRLKRVREAFLEKRMEENSTQAIVPIPKALFESTSIEQETGGLDISVHGFSIRVTQATPLRLLSSVLQVLTHAE